MLRHGLHMNSRKHVTRKSHPEGNGLEFPHSLGRSQNRRNNTFIVTTRRGQDDKGSKAGPRRNERTNTRNRGKRTLQHEGANEIPKDEVILKARQAELKTEEKVERYSRIVATHKTLPNNQKQREIRNFSDRRIGERMAANRAAAVIALPLMLVEPARGDVMTQRQLTSHIPRETKCRAKRCTGSMQEATARGGSGEDDVTGAV